jgi:hypothetical protein
MNPPDQDRVAARRKLAMELLAKGDDEGARALLSVGTAAAAAGPHPVDAGIAHHKAQFEEAKRRGQEVLATQIFIAIKDRASGTVGVARCHPRPDGKEVIEILDLNSQRAEDEFAAAELGDAERVLRDDAAGLSAARARARRKSKLRVWFQLQAPIVNRLVGSPVANLRRTMQCSQAFASIDEAREHKFAEEAPAT